jgi:hypothetical protein
MEESKRGRGRPRKTELSQQESQRNYYWNNRTKIQRYQREYYRKNREKMRTKRLEYHSKKDLEWKGEIKGFSVEHKPVILKFD